MKDFSGEVALSKIRGQELTQICFGLYHIALNFDSDTSISVECEIRIKGSKNTNEIIIPPYNQAASLLKFLGKKVVDTGFQLNDPVLSFSEDFQMKLIRKNDGYESFQIRTGAEIHIV